MSQPAYDTIGHGYAEIRRPDPRIAARIEAALGDAESVLNVGAGAGSYEPADREVTAVEPSAEIIAQRPDGAAPVVQARAEELPFADESFDAAMAIITIHHWEDLDAGLREMKRVARRRIVVLTADPEVVAETWIAADYFPEVAEISRAEHLPIGELAKKLPSAAVEVVACPRDCSDVFVLTLWARPELHLDPIVRRASSNWHRMRPDQTERGLERLRADLESGRWDERYGHLRGLEELDVGLRLLVAEL